MSNCEKSNIGVFSSLINLGFYIYADGTSTLVQQGKLRPVTDSVEI